MRRFSALLLVVGLSGGYPLFGQGLVEGEGADFLRPPETYEILGIAVEGISSEPMRNLLVRTSALAVGQEVSLPGDEVFSEAIRRIYRLGMFSDVDVVAEKFIDSGLYVLIRVREEPKLNAFEFTGIKKSQRNDLRKELPLLKGRAVKPGDVDRAKQVISNFYKKKGHPLAEVSVTRNEMDDRVDLIFEVDPGPRAEVAQIVLTGNEAVSGRKIRRKLKETKEDRWWRFWKRETFKENGYREDLDNLVDFYNQRGFYDARVVRDSVYLEGAEAGDPSYVIEISIHEGNRYFIREVNWAGNTEFSDQQLTSALGFQRGDVYNSKKLEGNLFGNAQQSDVGSLYYNNGYVQFQAIPSIIQVGADSLDLNFQIYEGDVFSFGQINIAGNTKTKEHVIRRNLRTFPGRTFTRDEIQRSLRELGQLGYFNPETLKPETRISPETKTVDITYELEETGGDQLEFSGGWGGFGGLLLQAGITFNNFSLQEMVRWGQGFRMPAGDGQRLSIGLQVQGQYYQNYYMSFTEPWFKGKPRPLGLSLSHSRYDLNASRYQRYYANYYGYDYDQLNNPADRFSITSASLSYGLRLQWPDDYFQTGSILGFKLYDLGDRLAYYGLPEGQNRAITFRQSLSRNSFDDPNFPTAGSSLMLSVEVAPPFPRFLQYHKWTLSTAWSLPLGNKVSFGAGADFGYVGSITGDRVAFERYVVGGTPFDAQYGFTSFGRDLIYMRGYPSQVIGPRTASGSPTGGTILNKFTSELRVLAIRSPQFTIQPYMFLDAANAWDSFATYNPAGLYRSTGVGVRVFLPILGMLNLNYGYNFDEFPPLSSGDSGERKWRFQFSLGQSF